MNDNKNNLNNYKNSLKVDKSLLKDLSLHDEGIDVDEVIENMKDKELKVSSFNPDEYKDIER